MDSGGARDFGAADLGLRLRCTAADSIASALRYLSGDRLTENAIDAAAQWIAMTEDWEDAFSLLALQIGGPGDMPWLGQAGTGFPTELAGLDALLRSTAAAARIGADRIRQARLAVLAAVDADYRPDTLG